MNDQKPTGVFVRLHDGMLNEKQVAALCNPKRSSTENILTIGTPVMGGELEVVGYADPEDLPLADGGPTNWTADINAKPDETCAAPLVRQSDAIAKLAEKDAEIARLWSALDEIEMGIDALPDDNEDYSRMSAREMQRQALEVVKAEVKALKGAEA